MPDVDEAVENFWSRNFDGIFDWYRKIHKESDVVISASPEFLLEGVCKKLGVQKMMASRVDKKTGRYEGENCHGEEKVRRFYEAYPDGVIDNFYSDSVSDAPLAKIAKNAFVIDKNGNVLEWEDVFPGTSK
ncbi:MAG: haloacid dehalogenase-like hydrolase [Clostridia bacterium]|nr:haloacid dehalogenase-like hydrolase [Clostridia bacterium]